ncbi:MAG: 4Fe-4S binding protein [Candidatus Edwardsbacteria bacterium]
MEDIKNQILSLLPGVNCGLCELPGGCEGYAEELADASRLDLCVLGGQKLLWKLKEILSEVNPPVKSSVAVLICQGGQNECGEYFVYDGLSDCEAAVLLFGGNKNCRYGCLGLGSCVRVCPKGAIQINQKNLAQIDPLLCDGCGICAKICPKGMIEILPKSQQVYFACHSLRSARPPPFPKRDSPVPIKSGYLRDHFVAGQEKTPHFPTRPTYFVVYLGSGQRGEKDSPCTVECNGCGICAEICPFQAITMIDGLPEIDYIKCRSCGICVHKCPRGCFIDRVTKRPTAFIGLQCDGCGKCKETCLMNAIIGEIDQVHKVVREVCIGCGLCFEICPKKAVTMLGALGHAGTTII